MALIKQYTKEELKGIITQLISSNSVVTPQILSDLLHQLLGIVPNNTGGVQNQFEGSAPPDSNTDNEDTGYTAGSLWFDANNGDLYICLFSEPGSADWITIPLGSSAQNNYSANIAPTANDDNTTGYSKGSKWFNTVSSLLYECVDNGTGAAVWTVINSNVGYKNLVLRFTQTGTDAPTIIIAQNTMINAVTTTRQSAGNYRINCADFLENKVWVGNSMFSLTADTYIRLPIVYDGTVIADLAITAGKHTGYIEVLSFQPDSSSPIEFSSLVLTVNLPEIRVYP